MLLDAPAAGADVSVAVVVATADSRGLLVPDESPAIHLKLGQASGWQGQRQMEQLAGGQIEVHPGRIGVVLQAVGTVRHPGRIQGAQPSNL